MLPHVPVRQWVLSRLPHRLDGVFTEAELGALRFHPTPPPTDEEVAELLATIRVRVRRLLRRRGLDGDPDLAPADPVAEASPALAGISSASVQGRIALGRRAGARVWRVGYDPDALWVTSTGPRQAHLDGFDLHANLVVPAEDRARLEQLARVVAYGAPLTTAPPAPSPPDGSAGDRPATAAKRRSWAWATLMRRAFDVDVLACPRCGGRLRLIATIDDPWGIREILASLTLSTEGADRAPPHLPAVHTGDPVGAGPA